MALSEHTVWDVRTTGSNTNGGGFVTGASGTDWSQQDAAQYAVTDAVTDGSSTITSATASFGTDVVGNILYITGGTGAIVTDFYQITVRNSATSITVERSTGLTTGTGATLNIGGSFQTIQTAMARMSIDGMIAYVKQGTYNLITAINTPTASFVTGDRRLLGYTTTHGDNPTGTGRPTVKTDGNAINALLVDNMGWRIGSFIFDGSGASAGLTGISADTTQHTTIHHCKVVNFSIRGIDINTGPAAIANVIDCEVTNCAQGITTTAYLKMINCWVHDNTGVGLICGEFVTILRSVISNNTGASSDGIQCAHHVAISHCVIMGNGRDGIRTTFPYAIGLGGQIVNNVLMSNGGYGIHTENGLARAYETVDYNAFFNNTSGARNVILAGPHDVTLTADPFINAAGNVYHLNTTAGGGAALRAAGFPGLFPGGLTTGYLDIGAAQHQDVASGGTTVGITAQLV